MENNKENITQKASESEASANHVEASFVEQTAVSLPPPSLQFKSNQEIKSEEKDGSGKSLSETNAYQFALASPPEDDNNNSENGMEETFQFKSVSTPFKMPMIQKKETIQNLNIQNIEKPAFKP